MCWFIKWNFSHQLRIHSLIITLAGLMFYRAFVLGITGGYPLRLEERHEVLKFLVSGTMVFLEHFSGERLFLIIFTIVLGYTKFGTGSLQLVENKMLHVIWEYL